MEIDFRNFSRVCLWQYEWENTSQKFNCMRRHFWASLNVERWQIFVCANMILSRCARFGVKSISESVAEQWANPRPSQKFEMIFVIKYCVRRVTVTVVDVRRSFHLHEMLTRNVFKSNWHNVIICRHWLRRLWRCMQRWRRWHHSNGSLLSRGPVITSHTHTPTFHDNNSEIWHEFGTCKQSVYFATLHFFLFWIHRQRMAAAQSAPHRITNEPARQQTTNKRKCTRNVYALIHITSIGLCLNFIKFVLFTLYLSVRSIVCTHFGPFYYLLHPSLCWIISLAQKYFYSPNRAGEERERETCRSIGRSWTVTGCVWAASVFVSVGWLVVLDVGGCWMLMLLSSCLQ